MKVGVLGAGHLGKIHIRCLKEIDEVELVGFYDPDEVHATEAINEFNIKRFNTISELINEVDIVDIVTPTVSHYDCASISMKKFKHVFIEKPITTTIEEALDLIKISQEANVKVQVGHVERYNPAFLAAKPYIKNPMFIEAHRLAQFNPRGTDVPVVLDLMIHDIDIVLSLVKANIKNIRASGVSVVCDTPDIANARIEFDNGCVANLTASRISMKNMRKARFFQKDAYIAVDFYKKETQIIRMKDVDENTDPFAIVIDLGKDKPKKQIYFTNPTIEPINSIKTELQSFINSILNNTSVEVSIYDGFNALKVAHQIMEKISLAGNNY